MVVPVPAQNTFPGMIIPVPPVMNVPGPAQHLPTGMIIPGEAGKIVPGPALPKAYENRHFLLATM